MARFVPRLLFTIALCAVGTAGPAVPDSFAEAPRANASAAASTVSAVVALTNVERRRAGIPVLRENTQLNAAAQLQSEQMGAKRRMDHVLRGTPYPKPQDRLAAVKYVWAAFGENVAMGQESGEDVLTAWMNSPGHRANILNANFTELGVGYAIDAKGRPYYTQVFARPAR